jgi:DNA mismatch endonuclease (patch repair protein)
MSRIRSRGNKETELELAKLLRSAEIAGWRRQQIIRVDDARRRAGRARPTNVSVDFAFPKQRVAVFVDGCFWHGCRWHCTYSKLLRSPLRPLRLCGSNTARSGKAFWLAKLAANKRRDRFVTRQLRQQGWTVIRIWEHELKAVSHRPSAVSFLHKIRQALR